MIFVNGSDINGVCPPDEPDYEPDFVYCEECGCSVYENEEPEYGEKLCNECLKKIDLDE